MRAGDQYRIDIITILHQMALIACWQLENPRLIESAQDCLKRPHETSR